MIEGSASPVPDLARLYGGSSGEVSFSEVAAAAPSLDETSLAELIEADGRHRISSGRPVSLQRYFEALPDLRNRPDALDAAVDVALRAMSGGARATIEAVDELTRQYPELAKSIHEAAALNAAIWSTSGLQARIVRPPARNLPCDFGPVMPDGRQRYQLKQLLGQGGFGQVYLALDRQLSEESHTALVAIKILVRDDRSPAGRKRLTEEATKSRRISHRNVVQVLDRGATENDEDFIVYEYVDGGDLSHAMAGGLMPVRQAVRLVARIAQGVHAAHAAGVIHCDLKPGNIMLTASGEPKVADFGVAMRADEPWRTQVEDSRSGPIGNVAFISPEQFRGEDHAVSVHSDVYAIGGILFLLLTGTLPNGSTVEEIARTHDAANGRTAPPAVRTLRREVDRDLEAACRRAMATQPADRYASAAALADDLERWVRLEPIPWTRPGAWRILRLWGRRKPALAVSVAVSIALVLAGSAVALHFASVARANEIERIRADIELAQKAAWQAHVTQTGKRISTVLGSLNGHYRFSTEAFMVIWAMEHLYGPRVLDLPEVQQELWQTRIAITRGLIRSAAERGRERAVETLLWKTMLAFWLISSGDHAEAGPLVQQNRAEWQALLAGDDPWLSMLDAFSNCCVISRCKADAARADKSEGGALHRAAAGLAEHCASLQEDERGTPVHLLLLRHLVIAFGPDLLNDPRRAGELTQELTALQKQSALAGRTRPKPSEAQDQK